VAGAFDVTVASYVTETRERILLKVVTARAAGHAATLAESRKISAVLNREADRQELLRMNDDEPCERSFHCHPFAVDIFCTSEFARLPYINSSDGNAASTPS
jgi:hypothetical protein